MIRTHQLTYAYPGHKATHYPDIDLPQGHSLLLQGPSGSGKSTWLALAAGLLTPTTGRIEVNHQSPADLPPARRDGWRARTVGFLPQKNHLSPALTVTANLELVYFAAHLPNDPAAIAELLRSLGLADLARRRPAEVSSGQALRVSLARALLLRPGVLLADEPTANLDDHNARLALDLLHDHAQRHQATLVVATHDARAVQALPQAHVLRLEGTP